MSHRYAGSFDLLAASRKRTMTVDDVISQIDSSSSTDELEIDKLIDEISEELELMPLDSTSRERIIAAAFRLIERQPEEEFTSWSLIHFVEGMDSANDTNYLNLLIESLDCNPKHLTLLLLNRFINATENSNVRYELIQKLKQVAERDGIETSIKNEAQSFYEYQIE